MNKIIDALKLAEEALAKANHFHDYEDELVAIREALANHPMDYDQGFVDGVEAQLIEPVQQEPVAWMDFHGNVKNNEEINDYIAAGWGKDKAATYSIPLYASPVSAKREWVGPTPQDVYGLVREGAAGGGWQGFASRLSAWLKEKNNG